MFKVNHKDTRPRSISGVSIFDLEKVNVDWRVTYELGIKSAYSLRFSLSETFLGTNSSLIWQKGKL